MAGAGNTIASNVGSNIIVRGTYPTGITGFTIRGNSIFGNQKPGIDLTGTGVPNPPPLLTFSRETPIFSRFPRAFGLKAPAFRAAPES